MSNQDNIKPADSTADSTMSRNLHESAGVDKRGVDPEANEEYLGELIDTDPRLIQADEELSRNDHSL